MKADILHMYLYIQNKVKKRIFTNSLFLINYLPIYQQNIVYFPVVLIMGVR